MKKPKPPKTFEEVEAFIKEKDLIVNPKWFWDAFGAADWHDTNGKPILNWKLKLYNLNELQISWGKRHRCTYSYSCKNPGVYHVGFDRDGHPMYRCIDHKPKFKPALPKEMTAALKPIPIDEININNRRNEEMRKLSDK